MKLAKETARTRGGCVMLGDIIHNTAVVEELASVGVRKVSQASEAAPGDVVLIRSHGESREILRSLEERGVCCVNATCPNVVRIQRLVARAEQEGRQPVIIGEPHHPEVMGVASWCAKPLVFDGPEAVQIWLSEAHENRACLLYPSDAADDITSTDMQGGQNFEEQ